MLRPAAALTIAALLTGCSGASVNLISADQISKFQVGKTNETEIVGALGKPIEIISEADGTKIDQYPYGGMATSSGGIMPSFLTGGSMPASYSMVSFSFGSNGVLKAVDGVK
jgi:hypothetical protein